jgi:hypothetical protein
MISGLENAIAPGTWKLLSHWYRKGICDERLISHVTQVTLRLTVGQSVRLGIEHPCGTCDQILLHVGMLLSEICGLVSVGSPLWREDGSAICSVITQWSESRRTRNHTSLSHLRLPQLVGPGSRIYIPQEDGGPVTFPGHWVPFTSPLATHRATVEVFLPSPNLQGQHISQEQDSPVQRQSHVTTDGQSISMSWCLVHEAFEGLHPN